jgi:hypothetical protein
MVYDDRFALRTEALAIRTAHDPEHQDDNGYERCAICHFTRHPCDAFDMADQVLGLLNQIEHPAPPPVEPGPVFLSLLDFATVDALVTKQHAETLAADLAAALHTQGYKIVRITE